MTAGVNPKDLIGLTKPPLRLLPPSALVMCSKVFALGASKYGAYNWREQPVRHSVYLEAAMRHILAAADGEEVDPESGMPHEAHAMACMAILLDAIVNGTVHDDRFKTGRVSQLMRELTDAN